MPRSLAASRRPWPAMICFASSTRTGLQKPNLAMLFAICRICFFECVRALFGYGRSSRTGVYSIFIVILSMHMTRVDRPRDDDYSYAIARHLAWCEIQIRFLRYRENQIRFSL